MCQHLLTGNVYAQVQLVYSLEVWRLRRCGHREVRRLREGGGGAGRKASHAEGKAELHYRSFSSCLLIVDVMQD